MQPVASTSKVPSSSRRVAQRSSKYLSIRGVPSTVLPNDIERFLGKVNVPPERIRNILRGLNDDYSPTDEYCVECANVEAAEDAIASARKVSKGHATTFNMFGGQLASMRFASKELFRHFGVRRRLIQPDFAGRTVRIGNMPKEAPMWAVRQRMSRQEIKIVESPSPAWYEMKYLKKYPAQISQILLSTLVPLVTGSPDFVAYLVRLESEQEAWRLKRLWHHAAYSWDERSVDEQNKEAPTRSTPPYRLTAEVVY